MKITQQLTALGFSALLLASCGGNQENDTVSETTGTFADTEEYTADDTTKFKFDFTIANIPSPAESMQEFTKWNVGYDNSILNNPQNASKYSTEFQRSINLGIYNIDMAYAMISDNGQDVLQYMKPILTVSDALGLKGAMNTMVGQRAESNLSNKDSLFKILDEIFVKSDTYLRTNERVYTAATVFAGSWLESLYITCKLSEKTSPDMKEQARKHLWEQRFHLGNLINLLNDYKGKKDCSELVAALKPIHEEIVAAKQPNELTDEKFNSIANQLSALRDKLVS